MGFLRSSRTGVAVIGATIGQVIAVLGKFNVNVTLSAVVVLVAGRISQGVVTAAGFGSLRKRSRQIVRAVEGATSSRVRDFLFSHVAGIERSAVAGRHHRP